MTTKSIDLTWTSSKWNHEVLTRNGVRFGFVHAALDPMPGYRWAATPEDGATSWHDNVEDARQALETLARESKATGGAK